MSRPLMGYIRAMYTKVITTIPGLHVVPTADVVTNTNLRDVVGNKTDAAAGTVAATKSIVAIIKGILEDTGVTLPASLVTLQNSAGNVAIKTIADLTGFDAADVFDVTGDVLAIVIGVVGATPITSTSGTTTLSIGTTEAAAAIIAASTVNNTQFAATDVWCDTTPGDDCDTLPDAWKVIGGGANIRLVPDTDDLLGGVLTLYCFWKPLSADGAVVASA